MISRRSRFAFAALAVVCTALFLGLGVWQIQRLGWKTRLIAQVEARLAAAPQPAPPPRAWASLGPGDAYRRVQVRGRLLNDRETLVQAVTALGGGFWVITPLRTEESYTVLVNRGFVALDAGRRPARTWAAPSGPVQITGLLRLSEPKGAFLRPNDPAADRWRSRDVAAIAGARRLAGPVAPYFIDAGPNGGAWPRGGLTVTRLSNNHLVYAIVWLLLAALSAWGAVRFAREGRDRE